MPRTTPRIKTAPPPGLLDDVALIDAKTAAAAGSFSENWWLREVRLGNAPKPAFRGPRCTRWRLSDVRAFWHAYANRREHGGAAEASVTQAITASKAATSKREAAAVGAY